MTYSRSDDTFFKELRDPPFFLEEGEEPLNGGYMLFDTPVNATSTEVTSVTTFLDKIIGSEVAVEKYDYYFPPLAVEWGKLPVDAVHELPRKDWQLVQAIFPPQKTTPWLLFAFVLSGIKTLNGDTVFMPIYLSDASPSFEAKHIHVISSDRDVLIEHVDRTFQQLLVNPRYALPPLQFTGAFLSSAEFIERLDKLSIKFYLTG